MVSSEPASGTTTDVEGVFISVPGAGVVGVVTVPDCAATTVYSPGVDAVPETAPDPKMLTPVKPIEALPMLCTVPETLNKFMSAKAHFGIPITNEGLAQVGVDCAITPPNTVMPVQFILVNTTVPVTTQAVVPDTPTETVALTVDPAVTVLVAGETYNDASAAPAIWAAPIVNAERSNTALIVIFFIV